MLAMAPIRKQAIRDEAAVALIMDKRVCSCGGCVTRGCQQTGDQRPVLDEL